MAVGLVAMLAGLLFKIGGLLALHRLLSTALSTSDVDWPLLVAAIAAVTMTLGNLAAFFQDDVRRLLAYSTISQRPMR